MEKLHINQVIVVEGKYDQLRLSAVTDALVIPTDGFRIYKDREKLAMLRAVARWQGIILLTDSDTAGFRLRNFIRSAVGNSATVTDVYIPSVPGKERRKLRPGKEGLLGVEGMENGLLYDLLSKAVTPAAPPKRPITKQDFYEDGLTGSENAAAKRADLLKRLDLPGYLSTNGLLRIINSLVTYEEYLELVRAD